MQRHIKNLDGTSKGVVQLESIYNTPQLLIDHAIEIAGSSPNDGMLVIFGNDLDHEESEQEVNVIALGLPGEIGNGILMFQNILDS